MRNIKIGVAGLVFNQDNQFLMILRDDSRTWALPGGMLERGESPPHGLIRLARLVLPLGSLIHPHSGEILQLYWIGYVC